MLAFVMLWLLSQVKVAKDGRFYVVLGNNVKYLPKGTIKNLCPCCGYEDDNNQVYCACDCYICEGLTGKTCLKKGETVNTKPLYKVAFTGHRPTKIGGYDRQNPKRVAVTNAIKAALARAVAKYGETHEIVVISGGALGVDTDAAREAKNMGLRFMVAAPCRNQDKKWPADSKMTYKKMLSFADADLAQALAVAGETVEGGVVYVANTEYTGAKLMQDRNAWMVDHADAVVAIWDGSEGGTANCVGYARYKRVPMVIINPKELS
jgi:uncharacterized phage-like protein YoqJ